MKKKLLPIISIMLVAAMLAFSGCKNKTDENKNEPTSNVTSAVIGSEEQSSDQEIVSDDEYKEATPEQKEALASRLRYLYSAPEAEKSNMIISGTEVGDTSFIVFSEDTSFSGFSDVTTSTFSILYDYSENGVLKVCYKWNDETIVNSDDNGKSKKSYEITLDRSSDRAYVSYNFTNASGDVMICKGYVYKETIDSAGNVPQILKGVGDTFLSDLMEVLNNKNATIEVCGDKVKITVKEDGFESTTNMVFEGKYGYKAEMKSHLENDFLLMNLDHSAENKPTTEKVSLPQDLENYSEEFDLSIIFGTDLSE